MKCYICDKDVEGIEIALRYGTGTLYRCGDCNFSFLSKIEDLENYYNKEYRTLHTPVLGKETNPDEIFRTHVSNQFSRLKILRSIANNKKSLLEIGCSSGQFLYNAKNLIETIDGLELNEEYADYASKKLGIEVKQKFSDLGDKKFDIICLFQVLEHIDTPKSFIENIKSRLNPKGKIIIEVPNHYDALLKAYNFPKYKSFFYHKAHLAYYNRYSLFKLLDSLGLCGEIIYTQDYNIMNHVNWIVNEEPMKDGRKGLEEFISLPIQDEKINKEFTAFFNNVDHQYKKLLEKYGITSNITFIGSIKES